MLIKKMVVIAISRGEQGGAGFQNIYSKVYIWRIVPKADSKVYICGIVHSLKQQPPLFLPWHPLALSLLNSQARASRPNFAQICHRFVGKLGTLCSCFTRLISCAPKTKNSVVHRHQCGSCWQNFVVVK